MSLKLVTKPLAASLKERIEAKKSESTGHRIAPPSAVNVEPDRNFVDKPPLAVVAPKKEPVKRMAAKKDKRGHYAPEFKAQIVARALKARETGEETIENIANEIGVWGTNIHNWIKAAKQSNGASSKAEKTEVPKKSDLKTLSRELAEAMDRVASIKKKMRKLLDVD
jgi:transposase-like protein